MASFIQKITQWTNIWKKKRATFSISLPVRTVIINTYDVEFACSPLFLIYFTNLEKSKLAQESDWLIDDWKISFIATFLADSSVGLRFDSHFIFFNQIKLQCDIHCSNKHHGNFNFKNILFHCVKIICQLLLWVTSCFKWRPKSEWYGPKFFFYK